MFTDMPTLNYTCISLAPWVWFPQQKLSKQVMADLNHLWRITATVVVDGDGNLLHNEKF